MCVKTANTFKALGANSRTKSEHPQSFGSQELDERQFAARLSFQTEDCVISFSSSEGCVRGGPEICSVSLRPKRLLPVRLLGSSHICCGDFSHFDSGVLSIYWGTCIGYFAEGVCTLSRARSLHGSEHMFCILFGLRITLVKY